MEKLHWEVVDDMREREADEVNLLLVGALPSDDENQWNYSKSMHNNCAHRHNKRTMSHVGKETRYPPNVMQQALLRVTLNMNSLYIRKPLDFLTLYAFIIIIIVVLKKNVVINLKILKDKPEMLQLLGVTWAFKPGIHDIYYTEDILSFYHCRHIL